MNSITVIGGAAGAEIPERDPTDSVERQVVAAARPALDAWHRRGLDGTVKFGDNEAPARVMAGILSLEFLVHAWDYAMAMGRGACARLAVRLCDGARRSHHAAGANNAGFDDPVDVPADAGAGPRATPAAIRAASEPLEAEVHVAPVVEGALPLVMARTASSSTFLK